LPDPSFYARIGRLSSVIFVLPCSMAVGWLIGHYLLDRFLPTYPWGTVGFTLLGAGAGFYEIVQILSADQRRKDDSS
jgi:F0F1-type ATP synthase assembly protein I